MPVGVVRRRLGVLDRPPRRVCEVPAPSEAFGKRTAQMALLP
jgi:hypothetical protein